MSEQVSSAFSSLINFEEEKFAFARVGHRRPSPRAPLASPFLSWASLNVRSIYGREETITDLMINLKIGVLALQETFVRANAPP